jgi:hypothetical protein
MPFRTPAFFRRGGGARDGVAAPAAPAANALAPPPAAAAAGLRADDDDDDDEAMLDDAMLDAAPGGGSGADGGAGRADSDAHAAALAADVLPDSAGIGSALGGLGAPPLFPLLPREELLTDEERAISLQGFGSYGCGRPRRRGAAARPKVFPCRSRDAKK